MENKQSILKFDFRNWYYVRSRGLTVLKDELLKYVDFEPMVYGSKDINPKLASFFCEIHYPFFLNGMPKTDENLYLKIYLKDYKRYIEIPASIVVDYWLSGWPRAGYMGELYTDFPWRLLKPIKQFTDNPTDIEILIDSLYPEEVNLNLMVIRIYYDHIIPWIKFGRNFLNDNFKYNLWLEGLKRLYDLAVDINMKQLLKAFSARGSGYAYTGIVVDLERYQNLSDEQKNNPFLTYMLDYCVPFQDVNKLVK